MTSWITRRTYVNIRNREKFTTKPIDTDSIGRSVGTWVWCLFIFKSFFFFLQRSELLVSLFTKLTNRIIMNADGLKLSLTGEVLTREKENLNGITRQSGTNIYPNWINGCRGFNECRQNSLQKRALCSTGSVNLHSRKCCLLFAFVLCWIFVYRRLYCGITHDLLYSLYLYSLYSLLLCFFSLPNYHTHVYSPQ